MARLDDPNWRLTCTLDFVRALGFELGLDLDNRLEIRPPAELSAGRVVELLHRAERPIIDEVLAEAQRERRQFIGGPLNGQRCPLYLPGSFFGAVVMRLARGRWAVYYRPDTYGDGRAFFVGEATNRRKARLMAYAEGPKLFAPQSQR